MKESPKTLGKSLLEQDLTTLLHRYSLGHSSSTPDLLLASHLIRCINAFTETLRERESFYGRGVGILADTPTRDRFSEA